MVKDMCSYHPLSKNLFAVNVYGHRKRKVDTMQRSRIVGSLAPMNTSTPQLLHLWFKKHPGKVEVKIVRARIVVSLH